MKGFLAAGGSVPGFDHTKPGQPGWTNNQDAFEIAQTDAKIVAVVCDGCSEMSHSDFGARFAANIAANDIGMYLSNANWADERGAQRIAAVLADCIVERIHTTAKTMSCGRSSGSMYRRVISEHFLFTMVFAIVTDEWTHVFSFGDGVFALNGKTVIIEKSANNAPPYLAYRLVPSTIDQSHLQFKMQVRIPTCDVRSLLIGSDGVADLIAAADKRLPGKRDLVGELSQFWHDDSFVKVPDKIRRRLSLVNLETVDYELDQDDRLERAPRIKHGHLPDDTTLVVIRREPEETQDA